jgi:hypothetical protein
MSWIRIDRKILENPFLQNKTNLLTWLYILLKVTYVPYKAIFNKQEITVQPGQGLFTMQEIATFLGMDRSATVRALKVLRVGQLLATVTDHRNTLITVLKWNEYQTVATDSQQSCNSLATVNDFPTIKANNNNITNNNKDITPITPSLEKSEKNKEDIEPKQLSLIPETKTPTKPKKEIPKKKYADYVSMTEQEFQKLVAKLGIEDAYGCIEILNSYKGANGKKYKSDYLAIKNWVIARLIKDKKDGIYHGRSTEVPKSRLDHFA